MIKIVCVGRIKESFYREAIDEYMKRLTKYHKVIIEEVMDSDILSEGKLILDVPRCFDRDDRRFRACCSGYAGQTSRSPASAHLHAYA